VFPLPGSRGCTLRRPARSAAAPLPAGGTLSAHDQTQASLTELLSRLQDQTRRLVRLEIRLAKAELAGAARRRTGYALLVAVAATLGLVALASGVVVVILALATSMPAWAAALIVCVVAGAVGGLAGLIGVRGLMRTPRRAAETMEEEARWTIPR
jgi:uncharacterized membrane protein YqjE